MSAEPCLRAVMRRAPLVVLLVLAGCGTSLAPREDADAPDTRAPGLDRTEPTADISSDASTDDLIERGA